jgi:hypothetical protein
MNHFSKVNWVVRVMAVAVIWLVSSLRGREFPFPRQTSGSSTPPSCRWMRTVSFRWVTSSEMTTKVFTLEWALRNKTNRNSNRSSTQKALEIVVSQIKIRFQKFHATTQSQKKWSHPPFCSSTGSQPKAYMLTKYSHSLMRLIWKQMSLRIRIKMTMK